MAQSTSIKSHHQDWGQCRSSWTSTSHVQHTSADMAPAMPPHSGNRSRLFTACWLLLPTSVTGLCGAYCFCVQRSVICVVTDTVACSSHLKCTCWNWIRKLLCASGYTLWAVRLLLTAAFEQLSCVLFWKKWCILRFKLVLII